MTANDIEYTDEDINEMGGDDGFDDQSELEDDDLEASPAPALEGFALAIEDRPVKPTRAPKAKELAWEEFLEFLKAKPGTTARVFLFNDEDAAKKARSRARSMRARMVKTSPEDMWNITAEELKEDGSWRVYATYTGPADEETIIHRQEVHENRVARGHAVAAARFAK